MYYIDEYTCNTVLEITFIYNFIESLTIANKNIKKMLIYICSIYRPPDVNSILINEFLTNNILTRPIFPININVMILTLTYIILTD